MGLVAGCATSIGPDRLGEVRAEWERRRQADSGKARLSIEVTNVMASRGTVHVGLYDAQTPFPAEGLDLATTTSPASGPNVVATFDDVPYGAYAVAVFQDLNGNGRLDTTLGIPREPFGFSNKASVGLAGTPSFTRASFAVDAPAVRQTIAL